MATIRPFSGIRYAPRPDLDFANVIAPPYDVLDEAGKAQFQARHPHNIVNVDLPWLPPKTVGPDEAYVKANMTLQAWIAAGILKRDARTAVYPYTQSYEHAGKTFHRRGVIAAVRLSPFGQGQIVPHEKTYPSAIEDRLKLMRATGAQLSPIFGLFSDARSELTRMLYAGLGLPAQDGTLNGVRNQLWEIHDNDIVSKVSDLLGTKPIYIADGHHRYTTALQYQKEMEDQNGGALPPNHPANFCMFVLVSMQDDGLLIFPTHRLIGGLDAFDIATLKKELGAFGEVSDTPYWPSQIETFMESTLAKAPPNSFGMLDGKTKKIYLVTVNNLEVMKQLEPDHSEAWRRLDVAVLQSYLLDQIVQKKINGGREITKGYTPDAKEAATKTDGKQYQAAFLLRPTPLHALEELGKTKEVMPQKSTYFYPKLATGMVINPIR